MDPQHSWPANFESIGGLKFVKGAESIGGSTTLLTADFESIGGLKFVKGACILNPWYRYHGKIHRWTGHRWIIDVAKWIHMSTHCLLSKWNEYQDFQHTSKYPVACVEFTMHGINRPSMPWIARPDFCTKTLLWKTIRPIFNPPVDWSKMTWSYIFSKHILFFTAQIIIYRNDFLMFLSEKYFFWNTLECAVLFYPNFDKIIMQLL